MVFLKGRLPTQPTHPPTFSPQAVTVQSEAYRQFEGLINPLDRIMSGLPDPQQGNEAGNPPTHPPTHPPTCVQSLNPISPLPFLYRRGFSE